MGNKIQRVDYLDMLKCLGMFIVVSGHIHPNYGWFSLPLHSFVIPLYFFLSGITFKRSKFKNVGELIKRRAKTLLLPYVMFSVLTWAVWALYNTVLHNNVNLWMPLLQTVIAQGSGGYLVHNVPLWFVTCLFVVEILYYFIDKLPEWANITICLVCAVIGHFMVNGGYIEYFTLLPWNFESAMSAILFYCAGNILTKHVSLNKLQETTLQHKLISCIAIIVLTLVLINTAHYNKHITLGSNSLGRNTLLFYLNAFMGITSVTLFSILVCAIPRKSKIFSQVINYCLFFGKNSFYIMATHIPVKGILMVIISLIIKKNEAFVRNDILCCAIVFAITCAICSIMAIFIGKWKIKDEQRIEALKKAKTTNL